MRTLAFGLATYRPPLLLGAKNLPHWGSQGTAAAEIRGLISHVPSTPCLLSWALFGEVTSNLRLGPRQVLQSGCALWYIYVAGPRCRKQRRFWCWVDVALRGVSAAESRLRVHN
jgi:hypothetical protein